MSSLAISELTKRVRNLSREKLLELPPEELAKVEQVLTKAKHERVAERCARIAIDQADGHPVVREDAGMLYWLQNLTLTEDDHWLAKGTPQKAPWPRKSFFRFLFGEMMMPVAMPIEECQSLYIPKSRQMMTSYAVCALITWMCQFMPGIFWVMQAGTEAKALELGRYVQILWDNQPEFLRLRYPLTKSSSLEKVWGNHSRVLAVAGGQNQIRGLHPWGYFNDESAFQPEFQECINSVLPVARQIVAVSTATPGPFAEACSQ